MIYRFANCTLDIERRELRRDGLVRPIEPQVFDLLRCLIENRERVVSRDRIFATVWHGRIVSDAVLSTRLNAVRFAIGDNGREQRLIRTLPKQGVRFVGSVEEGEQRPPPQGPVIASRRFASNLKDAPAIAILPVANLSDDHGATLFAGVVAEEIATALWRQDWLLVVGGGRFADARTPQQVREACDELAARYVLQASVRPAGTRMRMLVRLIEAQSGCHLWAHSFDIAAAETAAIDVATEIGAHVPDAIFAAEALRGRLTPAQRRSTWGLIVAALALINTRERVKVDAAEGLLRKAIAAEPDCAPAQALLSFIFTLRVHLAWRSRPECREPALALARRAIEADGDDPWSHLALGYALVQICNRPQEATEILRHALSLNPGLSMAHYLIALSSAFCCNTAEAFRHADAAERLHPQDLLARGNAGAYNIVRATTSFVIERYRDGMDHARAALAVNPRNVPAVRQFVIAAACAGEREEAGRALGVLDRIAPDNAIFVAEAAPVWTDPNVYQRYCDAFRLAAR